MHATWKKCMHSGSLLNSSPSSNSSKHTAHVSSPSLPSLFFFFSYFWAGIRCGTRAFSPVRRPRASSCSEFWLFATWRWVRQRITRWNIVTRKLAEPMAISMVPILPCNRGSSPLSIDIEKCVHYDFN